MAIKTLLSKTRNWVKAHQFSKNANYQPQVDNDGLISAEGESADPSRPQGEQAAVEKNHVVVKSVQPAGKNQSLEKLQEGFNKLVEQLQGINEHLNRQVNQQEELMNRMEQLPELLQSFPGVVENQKQIVEQMLDQLKSSAVKNEQFIDAVEKIPSETGKQTDALVNINHQLSAAADTDVQMTESFNKFNETLDKLNMSTGSQTDSIIQMSKTFSASDRYLKYIISIQNKRFMWIFGIAMAISVISVLLLIGIIIYLKQ